MSAQLIALRGPLTGRSFALSVMPVMIGRNLDSGIVVASDNASRRHALIRSEDASFVLHDLGSSNGTLVNGQRVQAHALKLGDLITIGDEVFCFELIGAQSARSIGATVPVARLPAQPQLPKRNASRPVALLLTLGILGVCMVLAAGFGGMELLTRSGRVGESSTPEPKSTPIVSTSHSAPMPVNSAIAPLADGKAWTVLVYLDGDNDLEQYAMADFNEMEQAGSNDQVNIVVQFDRISSKEAWDDRSNDDWSDTRRFLVTEDTNPQRINSEQLEDMGELNMGDPQTLADFITWGVNTYPAQRYALVIWDHGSSWPGVAYDATSDNQGLTLPRLETAFKQATTQSGLAKLDLIGFDACLMSQVDVLATLQPYTRVVVASAELEPGAGWAWDRWLGALEDDPGQDAVAVGKSIVSIYADSYQGTGDDRVTLAAFDMTRFDTLVSAVDTLAQALTADLQPSYSAIGEARSYVETYAQPQPEQFNAVDLDDFARLLRAQGASATIVANADEVRAALAATRISEEHGQLHSSGGGISIYFPQSTKLYLAAYEQLSPLPSRTKWADFLKAFHRAGDVGFNGPTIKDLRVANPNVSASAPLDLNGTSSGQNLAYAFFFVGTPNADRTGVQLVAIDFVHPPGSSQSGAPPNWQNGDNALSLNWTPVSWSLSNGQEQIPVLLGPVQYGSDSYGVEGVYRSAATGEETSVGLLFSVQDGHGALQRIWGFPRGQKGDLQPFELKPQPGDTFTASVRTYTTDGTHLNPAAVRGATLTFGTQPLEVNAGPAPGGNYVAGLLVRDVAGQFAYKYTDITIAEP